MSAFPQAIPCGIDGCAGEAKKIIRHAPSFSIEYEERGYNVGLGRHFNSRHERNEYLKSTVRVETNPLTGREEEVRFRDVYPEEVVPERQWLKDAAQAQADNAPIPVHPDVPKKAKIASDLLRKKLAKSKPEAIRHLAYQEANSLDATP